jgi:hypothetical protein
MHAILLLFTVLTMYVQGLPELPPQTMTWVNEARSLPSEFNSDVLLRLAASPVVEDRAWKTALIEEAFRAASRASIPYPRAGEGNTDARASRAFWANGLEALTLRSRAVRAMLEIDPPRARRMFEELPMPEVPSMSCQDPGAPNLSDYYETAGKIFEVSFSAEDREQRFHMDFLKRVIALTASPAGVTPAVRLVIAAKATPEERKDLAAFLAGIIDRVNGTNRVFGAVTFQLVPVSAPRTLPAGVLPAAPILEAPAGQIPEPVAETAPLLLPALRSYIVRHLSGPRCVENHVEGRLPTVANDFNYLASLLDPDARVYRRLSLDEIRPARVAETYPGHPWWQSLRSKQVLDALKWLNHGNRNGNDRFFTPEERASEEWNTRFIETIRLIEGWKESEESSREDWFGMVSEAYALLAEKAPEGTQRDAVMSRYLTFMETEFAGTAPNLWFTQLHGLWQTKDLWIAERMARSRNSVISLYSRMAQRIAELSKQ